MTSPGPSAIRRAATSGLPTFGTWISIPDRLAIETMARAGYEWAILDAQHGGIGWDAMLGAIQVLDLHGVPALVRVEANDPARIMRALDLGACGVIVPMVDTADQAAMAAQACRYPPHGNRSFGPVRSFYDAAGASGAPLCLPMIETATALANIDAIAATPGIDGLFVGPVDLGLSMGLSTQEAMAMPPPVTEGIARVADACRANGLLPGCAAFGLDSARRLADLGMRFLPLGADLGLLRRGAAQEVAGARAWLDGYGEGSA